MVLHIVNKISKNVLFRASIHGKCNGSLLCFAQFMERDIPRKQTHVIIVGGKWQHTLIAQIKISEIVCQTISIVIGLDKKQINIQEFLNLNNKSLN